VSTAPIRSRDWFYVALAAALLLVVLVGFAPTYYLRSAADPAALPPGPRELPAYLHWHGVALTSWFLLALAQPTLIATRRHAVHRVLGWLGAVVAVAVVGATFLVLTRAALNPVTGVPPEALPLVIVGDLFALVVFSLLVIAAVLLRHSREAHLRLMLLASVAIVGPAAARLPNAIELGFVIPAVQLAVPIALIVHDWLRSRRVHPATIAGTALIVSGTVAGIAVALSPLGQSLIEALR
jgi:hypothetical protein